MDIKEKEKLNDIKHSVRATQAVLQYGVGAMVDFPEQTLMTAAPETWEDSIVKIHDERLEKALDVDFFGMPGDKTKFKNGISYVRFPEWYFCPVCKKFMPLKQWIKKRHIKSTSNNRLADDIEKDPNMIESLNCCYCKSRPNLVAARIVTVCENGHISDFPWVEWVHARNLSGSKPICCENPVLELISDASASDELNGITIRCTCCGAKTSLSGVLNKDIFKELDEKTNINFRCKGLHPWKNEKESCIKYPRTVLRGASSVYFPHIVSSLVIPPYSSRLNRLIEESAAYKELILSIENAVQGIKGIGIELTQQILETTQQNQIQNYLEKIALEIAKPKELILPVLKRKFEAREDEVDVNSRLAFKAEEYDALNGTTQIKETDDEFVREEMCIDLYNIPYIKGISLIHKVREVQALIGFSRLEPISKDIDEKNENISLVTVKKENTNWYPGYEVRGEGIFIEFDEDAINDWRTLNNEVKNRTNLINENYRKSYYGKNSNRVISSKFILLHTLSHLLMKQLSFECGYNIASIKERIYCSDASEGKSMSGILIYTASGDAEGTLGGLVRQGRPDVFGDLFRRAIEAGRVCSNDPVCNLSQGQGRDSLNLAACYACTLVPETSCEEYNVFLDRAMVIGTFENSEIGFYSKYNQEYGNKSYVSQNAEYVEEQMKNPVLLNSNITNLYIISKGTSMKELSYKKIWGFLKNECNKNEQKKINYFIDNIHKFNGKEKPYRNVDIKVNSDDIECNLLWDESKIMLFISDYEEDYNKAKNSDWKCYYFDDELFDCDDFISNIKEVI